MSCMLPDLSTFKKHPGLLKTTVYLLLPLLLFMAASGCIYKDRRLINSEKNIEYDQVMRTQYDLWITKHPSRSNPEAELKIAGVPYYKTKEREIYGATRHYKLEALGSCLLAGGGIALAAATDTTQKTQMTVAAGMVLAGLVGGYYFFLKPDKYVTIGGRSRTVEPSPGDHVALRGNVPVSIGSGLNDKVFNGVTDRNGQVTVNLARDLGLYQISAGHQPVFLEVEARIDGSKETLRKRIEVDPGEWLAPYGVVRKTNIPIYKNNETSSQVIRRAGAGEHIPLKNASSGSGMFQLANNAGWVSSQDVEAVFFDPVAQTSFFEVEMPSDLVFRSPQFEEHEPIFPNGALDAQERGWVTIECANQGQGLATNVVAEVSSNMKSIKTGASTVRLGDISPGDKTTLKIPVASDLSVPDREFCDIRVVARDETGGTTAPLIVKIPIRTFVKPQLSIQDRIEIVDAGFGRQEKILPNGIIDPGETVKLKFSVLNKGEGEAKDVVVSVEPGMGAVVKSGRATLGSILPGRLETGTVELSFPVETMGQSIPCLFRISEARTSQFPELPYTARVSSRQPKLVVSHRLADSRTAVETGDTFELVLTVANMGELPARGTSVSVQAFGIELLEGQTFRPGDITGRIEPRAQSDHRVIARVPRKGTAEKINFMVRITQDDYPEETAEIEIPLRQTLPELELIVELEGGGKDIQQGTRRFGWLRLRNTGNQDATNIQVAVKTPDRSWIRVEPERFDISHLSAGGMSEAQRIEVFVAGAQPAGTAHISFSLDQDLFGTAHSEWAFSVTGRGTQTVELAPSENVPEPVVPKVAVRGGPQIVISSHRDGEIVSSRRENFRFIVNCEGGLSYATLRLNGELVYDSRTDPGAASQVAQNPRFLEINVPLEVAPASNLLEVVAWDVHNRSHSSTMTLQGVTGAGWRFEPDLGVDIENVSPTGERRPEAVAVVVGLEHYENLIDAPYAGRDALLFGEYAKHVLGIPQDRIILKLDQEASLTKLRKLFSRVLPAMVVGGKSEIYVYIAGHGIPDLSQQDKKPHLVPYDGDMEAITETCYSLDQLYLKLGELPAKNVYLIIDACFTGFASRSAGKNQQGKLLLAEGIRPAFIQVQKPRVAGNVVVFHAATEDQVSSAYPGKKHGLFTYFFLKGMAGAADSDSDRQVTVKELMDYLKSNVSSSSNRFLGRLQTPTIQPDISVHPVSGERVISSYR